MPWSAAPWPAWPQPLRPLLLQHLPTGPVCTVIFGFRLCKVPVDWSEELLGLLVGPVWVQEQREQSQPNEEQGEMWQVQAADQSVPVPEAHPPHVVGEDHAAVEHVDHQPLVGLPEQRLRPAGLQREQM